MTREEAKAFASIPRETLEEYTPNLAKHYEILIAYAKGETIEWYCERAKKWECPDEVFFCANEKYRVKKAALKGDNVGINLCSGFDGKPLTAAEKTLIRFFRRDKGKYLNLLTDAALNLILVLHEHDICEILGEASQMLVYVDDDGDVNFKKDVVALEFMNADVQEAVTKAFVAFEREKEREAQK